MQYTALFNYEHCVVPLKNTLIQFTLNHKLRFLFQWRFIRLNFECEKKSTQRFIRVWGSRP